MGSPVPDRSPGSIDPVTDGFEQWVVELPVWFQAPLVLAALVIVAVVVTAALLWVLSRVLPPDEAERRAFGGPGRWHGNNREDSRGGGDPE